MPSHSVASSGAGSAVPGLVPTSPSKICRAGRKVSPSLANAGSSETGSDEPANTNVPPAFAPLSPLPELGSSRLLSAQPARASAAAPSTAAARNDLLVVLRMPSPRVLRTPSVAR